MDDLHFGSNGTEQFMWTLENNDGHCLGGALDVDETAFAFVLGVMVLFWWWPK